MNVIVSVSAATARAGLVDVEILDGVQNVAQRFWDSQSFSDGQPRAYWLTWTAPPQARTAKYTVRIGVFSVHWGTLLHWNGRVWEDHSFTSPVVSFAAVWGSASDDVRAAGVSR